ncbi:MAG: MarR family winged helix-turn-helix transcriptional regulator [Thermoleophilaceae bacterium]
MREADATIETGAAPAEFDAAWDDFFAAIRRARARAAREPGGELTIPQFQLLVALGETPGTPVGELAAAAEMSHPTATRMLDSLERAGVVERRHSSDDRRVVAVHLTRKGRRLLERKRALISEKRRALYDSLDEPERVQVERLLRRLAQAIEDL